MPNRFMHGLRDSHIQQRLFMEQGLPFKMAYDIAHRAEGAVKQQRDLKSQAGGVQQAVAVPGCRNVTAFRLAQCSWLCDDDSHHVSALRFRSVTCNFRCQPGHIERACQQKQGQRSTVQGEHWPLLRSQSRCKGMHHVDDQQAKPSEARVQSVNPCFDLYALNTMLSPPKLIVTLSVHRQPVDFEMDSGAACSLPEKRTFRATWLKFKQNV